MSWMIMKKSISYLLAIFLILMGSIFLYVSAYTFFKYKNAKVWPKTEAIVESSQIKNSLGRQGIIYCPIWNYSFVVGQQRYNSGSPAFGSYKCFYNYSNAQLELGKHPLGSKIVAIYNPSNPSDAALNVNIDNTLAALMLL